MEVIYITLAIMGALLVLSLPIGVAIGLATLCGLFIGDLKLALFTQRFFNTFDSFPLMAVPFFILAGDLMASGSLSANLLAWCRSMVGHKRGGMAHISTITCLFYGALCGSAVATVAAVGGIMIPAMEEDSYPKSFSCGLNAAAGCLGVMIPPSIPLILYGSFGSVSISDLFIAGIVPGLLIAACLMAVSHWMVVRGNYGTLIPRMSLADRMAALKKALPALGVPVIILGGIYSGIISPTEAGVVAVVYALVVETFISRVLTLKKLCEIVKRSMISLGMMFLIIITANGLGTLFLYYNVHIELQKFIMGLTTNPHVFIFIMLIIYLILGTFMEAGVAIILLAPILVPICISYGIDPVHFGIFTLVSLCIGFLTPPVGTNLFVTCSIGDIDILRLSRAVMPFIAAMMVGVLLIAYVPAISLCLL